MRRATCNYIKRCILLKPYIVSPFLYISDALYISYISMGIGVNGVLPLYYETGIETTFPISEDVTMGVMTMLYNILPVLFLIVSQIPNIGKMGFFSWGTSIDYVRIVINVIYTPPPTHTHICLYMYTYY